VRLALWNYRKGSGMTAVCDADVQARCPALAKNRGMYRAGVVGKCLAKQVAQGHSLSQGCRRLVMVAVPRDVRSLFDRGMSLEAVAGKVARVSCQGCLCVVCVYVWLWDGAVLEWPAAPVLAAAPKNSL
jgi:hypothetical protein